MSSKLPKDWLGCPKNGKYLIASKFMTLKTPLNSQYDGKLNPVDRFHPEDIFLKAGNNNVKFGLWIDLTNTNRYYSKEDIEKQNCRYVKINCTGHGECPSRNITQRFISVVHDFILEAPHACIAVHCTHGFNRTGFLITSFLVENLGYIIKEAVEEFSTARPPGIYRDNYIKELFRRYSKKTCIISTPSMPSWVNSRKFVQRRRKR